MRAKRIDANQNEIVKIFRNIGCSVTITSMVGKGFPDIAVGYRGQNYFFELKDGKKCPSQQKLTSHEDKFKNEWKGQYDVLTSVDDVIKFLSNIT